MTSMRPLQLTFAYLVLGLLSTVSSQWQSGQSTMMNSNNGNGFNCNTQTSSYIRNGQKIQTVSLRGCGIIDDFEFEVPTSAGGLSVSNMDNCLIITDPGVKSFFIFSDEPSTLVIKRDGVCTKKTYTTNSNGRVTSTSTALSRNECQQITQRVEEEQEKNRKHWEQWNQNFHQNMQQAFPPGFPFHNKQNQYQSRNDIYGSQYMPPFLQQGNVLGGISNMATDWTKFGGNFAQNMAGSMKKAFRPRFPFN